MKAPSGLFGAIQFVVLKAGAAHTIKRAITTSLTATIKLLNRAVSRMPVTNSAVMTTITNAAGTLRTAPVSDHACCTASYVKGDETNRAGRFSPKSPAKLTTYPDQPIETAIAPTAYSR